MSNVCHRLRRLRGSRAHFALLALDHGLTYGHCNGSPPLPLEALLTSCKDCFGGFVTTYGIARNLLEWPSSLSIVLQCFGAPENHSRRQVASLQNAVLFDAAAVSVQLSWADPEIDRRIPEICAFTADAHSAGMPVLFMVGGLEKSSEFPRTIRICQEMGADLIKVGCAKDNFACVTDDLEAVIRQGPPVLMAGGAASTDLSDTARRASQLGMAGFCVGRHIFTSKTPAHVATQLNTIFLDHITQ